MLRSGGLSSGGLLLLAKIARNVSIPLLASGRGKNEAPPQKGKGFQTTAGGSREAASVGSRHTLRGEDSPGQGHPLSESLLLELVIELLASALVQSSRHVAAQVCDALLTSTGLVGTLIAIARSEQSPEGVQCLALQGLEGAAALVARINEEGLQKEICAAVVPLVNLIISLSGQGKEDAPRRPRALLKQGLLTLRAVTASCGPCFWDADWASTAATFWLSRLSRDHEASVRASAFALIASAAFGEAPGTCQMLASYWPEVAQVAVKAALDVRECYAVRQEAVRFISSAERAEKVVGVGEDLMGQIGNASGGSNRRTIQGTGRSAEPPTGSGTVTQSARNGIEHASEDVGGKKTSSNEREGPVAEHPALAEIAEGSLDREEASLISGVSDQGGGLGLDRALRQRGFLEKLPGLFLEKGAPLGFMRSLTSLLASSGTDALVLDVLAAPVMWPLLVQLLNLERVKSAPEAVEERRGQGFGILGLLDRIASAGHVADLTTRIGHVSDQDRCDLINRFGALSALAECFCSLSNLAQSAVTEGGASMRKWGWVLAKERAVTLESVALALSSVTYWKGAADGALKSQSGEGDLLAGVAARNLVKSMADLLKEEALEEGCSEAETEKRASTGFDVAAKVKLAVCKMVISLLKDNPTAEALLGEGAKTSQNESSNAETDDSSSEYAAARDGHFSTLDGPVSMSNEDFRLGEALYGGVLPLYQEARRQRLEALSLGASHTLQSCTEALAASGGALRSLVALSRGAKAGAVKNDLPGTLLDYARDTQALLRLESLHLPLPYQGPPRQRRREGRVAASVVTVRSAKRAPEAGPAAGGAQHGPQPERRASGNTGPSQDDPGSKRAFPRAGAKGQLSRNWGIAKDLGEAHGQTLRGGGVAKDVGEAKGQDGGVAKGVGGATGQPSQNGGVARDVGDAKGDGTSAVLLEDLLLSLNLLKHLAYDSPEAAEAVLKAGALALVRETWNYAQAESAVRGVTRGLVILPVSRRWIKKGGLYEQMRPIYTFDKEVNFMHTCKMIFCTGLSPKVEILGLFR
jgi:hypothetical protein